MRRVVVVLVLAVVVGAFGGATVRGAPTPQLYQQFRSRPDLRPPRVIVRRDAAGTAPGLVFVAPKRGEAGGPLIMDDHGRVVWFHPVQPRQAADFRMQRYRGRPVLTWWEGTTPILGVGSGTYVVADASYRIIARIPSTDGLWYDLHEFQLTPRGTALITAYRPVQATVAGRKGWVLDSVVREVNVASRRVVFEWHSLAHVPLSESEVPVPDKTSADQPYDYFHVNSIALDRDRNFIVSGRNTSAVYKVRRSDGAIVWELGGEKNDFDEGPGVAFHWQHDVKRRADGTLTLFDNDAAPPRAQYSRALVLRLDERRKTARLVRSYAHPAKLLSPHQGSMQTLPNRDVFVGWGGIPVFSEFSRGGRLLFDARISVGDTYRAYRFPWSGRPREAPAVAVRGEIVYASWNGATAVARWQVVGGARRGALHPLGGTPKVGFETPVPFRGSPKYVAVRALDASGRVLGTSRVVARG